jgi:nickel-type superoxide dismutase maturation protease
MRHVVVEGESMSPTYRDGDDVLALRPWRRLREGDVVLLRDPREPERWLIKRISARRGGSIEVLGDNAAASTDSRHFGPLSVHEVAYLVISRTSSGT